MQQQTSRVKATHRKLHQRVTSSENQSIFFRLESNLDETEMPNERSKIKTGAVIHANWFFFQLLKVLFPIKFRSISHSPFMRLILQLSLSMLSTKLKQKLDAPAKRCIKKLLVNSNTCFFLNIFLGFCFLSFYQYDIKFFYKKFASFRHPWHSVCMFALW